VNLEAFLAERGPEWDNLEATLKRAGGRPERLGAHGALELGRGYRAAVADLALARRRYPGDPVVERLERLVLAARQAVYGRRRGAGTLLAFATQRYWQLVAERRGMLALAALATFLPCVLAAAWALHDPGAALGLVPQQFRAAAHPHIREFPFGATTQAALASSIFTNNIQVTFLAFGGGLLLGAGSLAVLAYNGVILGALGGVTLGAGNFAVFVRYIVPHGILELSCFTVAGAAGLRLGWALIDAGTLPRGESLRRAARPAVGMILGTAPCLIVAGLTEGFVTPRGLPLGAALAVGIFLGAGFWTLVFVRGRRVTAAPAALR
jgi:uncharacterized membrane protein SpoIIM required for sporulation